ncbi:MAG: CHAP domain-containing protein [Citromicrobium sp.]|nr:CHAP domain-containing protein [Citromicrobium sp.]
MDCRPRILFAPAVAIAASLAITGVSQAQAPIIPLANSAASGQELPPYLQCVPYAREVSGIDIYGDAYTWWEQAAGRFERGQAPRVGAVMAFVPHRNMRLGHVAAVSRVIDSRTVLLDHANWSPVDGQRGRIERNVKAVDVSPNNDWSEVRVWYDPLQGLGKTAWPVYGFIYPDEATQPRRRFAQATPQPRQPQPTREEPSRAFLAAFSAAPEPRAPRVAGTGQTPRIAYATARPLEPQRVASGTRSGKRDVAARAVALYD